MGIKVITAPLQAIPTAELRLQSRADADSTTEDVLFVGWIAAAVKLAQHWTGRSIGEQTLELALDSFPAGPVALLQGPVTGISSIKYLNSAGVEQTLASSAYTLDDYGLQHWAVAADGWPDTGSFANSVKARYVAGDAILDPAVKTALHLMVGHWYAQRAASSALNLNEIPLGAQALLDTVKIWAV